MIGFARASSVSILLGLGALLMAPGASAFGLSEVYRGGGHYGQLTAGGIQYIGDDALAETDQEGGIFGLGVGFRLSPFFSVELNLARLTALDPSEPVNDDAERGIDSIIFSTLYHLHLSRSVELYGRLGGGFLFIDDEEADYEEVAPAAQAGLGLQFWLTESITFKLEASHTYARPDDEEGESANLQFHGATLTVARFF
ncbi:MAG: hypothetical protein EA349_07935 [Halomonadaceae bacterium]|nr:MAG: hypothetical protein EA349_07935 [Halomonadaceae bacterium]